MKSDIRQEQLRLLRFEKQIAGLAEYLAASAAAAAMFDHKLGVQSGRGGFEELRAALFEFAQTAERVHNKVNTDAMEAGVRVYNATGGLPKKDASKVVASLLGIA